MWNKVWLCKVLILVILTLDITGFKKGKPFSREQIYIDVLQNITQVNKILNNLLGNYKHLKAIYEAQAKPENQLSVEKEIGDGNEEKNDKTDYDNDPDFRPVTQMILFDQFPEESSHKSNESIDIQENLQFQFPDNIKIDYIREKNTAGKLVNLNKNVIDLTRTDLLLQDEVPSTVSPINLSNKPELIIVGTALKYSQNTPNTKNENVEKFESELSSVPKDENFDSGKLMLRAGYDNSNEYRYENLYQPTKWKNPYEYSLHQRVQKKNVRNYPNNKTVLVFVVNRQKKDILFENNRYKYESENRNENILRREQLERKILRDAYGSACLKVAVRKCYKTLTEVRKLMCTMNFKCKNSFKSKFKSYSKVGCMTEFNYKEHNGNKQNRTQYYKRKKTEIINNIRVSNDKIRDGSNINYYELCLPVGSEETNVKNLNVGKKRSHGLNRTEPINVLRDRYEKECKRISTEKCVRACNYAVENSCGQDACERKEKKKFTRMCRRECQIAFDGSTDSDTDDDSDSNEDSDSDDSDDSDGDTRTFE